MITDEQLAKDREAIPFTPTKRLMRDDILYVVEKDVPHPVYGYSKYHKEYSVIDLRGYRKGYEPRLDIKGIYTPNPTDTFRLQDGHLPPYQPTTTGDKLLAEMRRLGVHKVFRIGMPPTTEAGGNPNGTCYEDAWRFLIKEEEGELIHGSVESLGRRIGHAWVELPTGFIWEPETRQFLKKADFEAIAKPLEEARYGATEAAIMLARVGKHGPWTEEERKQWLKGGNPVESRLEPWQMTQEEFVKIYLERFKSMLSKEAFARVTQKELQKEKEEAIDYHKHTITQALAAGRPVPLEVLKDYREFGEKIAKELNLRYDGIQEELGMQFTDIHGTGTSFYATSMEGAREQLRKKRRLFGMAEGDNPMGKVITKEEAIGMLERLSMTPEEAARSLVADEAERSEIMRTVQERVKREQHKFAPFDPREGPPLPRIFGGLRWPWRK